MDYEEFSEEYKKFEKWNAKEFKDSLESFDLFMNDAEVNDAWLDLPKKMYVQAPDDRVNSPSHYTRGKVEAIEIIEDAIKGAPSVKAGMLQAQVLKYILRLWFKDNSFEDAKKAQWYLNRLIENWG